MGNDGMMEGRHPQDEGSVRNAHHDAASLPARNWPIPPGLGPRATSQWPIMQRLTEDEVRFYDALATNESAVRELTDETLKKIAHELTENLRQNLTVDWSERESVRAKLRLMVKRVLRKYKYPPDLQEEAVDLVLRQAQVFGDNWGGT